MTVVDMRKHGAAVQLVTVELGLAFHCKTGMNLPGTRHRTALVVAFENGWTRKRTNRGALLDIIAFRRVNDPEYYPTQHILDSMHPNDLKKVPGIIRKADKFVAQMEAHYAATGEQTEWVGF